MATPDPWPVIHSERGALADDLSNITAEQWQTESLCRGWSVHDVLGHLTATAKMTPPQFFIRLAGSGFRFNAMADKNVKRETAGGPAATLSAFRAVRNSTSAPPGPVDSWLGEAIVHAEDIRRPLGISHTYPPDALREVADFYKASNVLIGAKNRIAGLRLEATDTDWTTGSGAEVRGPMLSLVLAMTGRTAAIDDLAGDGVETLRSRD